jgi:hypothetical protein
MTVRQSSSTSADRTNLPAGSWLGAAPYAAAVRRALEGCGVTAAELASATGYSYEQIRRVLKGEPIVSEQLNELLCTRLALDVPTMWAMALHEKALRRLTGESADAATHAEQRRLLAGFARLGDADRRRVMNLLQRLEQANLPGKSHQR